MKRKIILICTLFLLSGGKSFDLQAENASSKDDEQVYHGEFDGSSWKVQFMPDKAHGNIGAAFQDTFIFQDGLVTCKLDAARGFESTEYGFGVWLSSTNFSFIQAANRQGKKIYTGAVKNRLMSGNLIWEKEVGKAEYYVFQGTEIRPLKPSGHKAAKTAK